MVKHSWAVSPDPADNKSIGFRPTVQMNLIALGNDPVKTSTSFHLGKDTRKLHQANPQVSGLRSEVTAVRERQARAVRFILRGCSEGF